MNIATMLAERISHNYHRPKGIAGRIAGELMVHQHQPENAWSVSLLDVQPADHILEVGFGPGVAIQLLADQAHEGRIAGIDYSRTMVKVARRRNARGVKAGRIDLRYGEATILPFSDKMFDKALSIHTLYFWAEPVKALTELYRVLKPGGTLVLTFMPQERWPGSDQDTSTMSICTGPAVVQLMHEAGFAHAHIETGPEQKPFREIAVVAIKR